jgi:two-component system sensor histidine kinase BaeS
VRRFGCLFAALLILSTIGAGTVVSLFFRAPGRTLPVAGAGAVLVMVVTAVFVAVLRRVTLTFRAQDTLRRQLLADVAHELRTPLSILQGRLEGLLDGVYARDDARLEELLAETRHLARLVEDVRTLANAEAGALELRKERVDAAELIGDAAAAFDGVEVQIDGTLPAIDADPVRLREVLLNLLANAARAGGAVRVSAEPRGRGLRIRVADSGRGIPAEELPRIFDRFVKSRESGGSGLGLAIARKLVEAHGGTIAAQSRVGEGTTVTIDLPA